MVGINSDLISVNIPQNYKNTWNFALGANIDVTPKWALKFGVGYDMTPTNDQDRNIQVPDENRFIASTGVAYHYSKALTFDLAYAHFFVQKASINNTVVINGTDQTTVGNVDSYANLLGFQMQWKF